MVKVYLFDRDGTLVNSENRGDMVICAILKAQKIEVTDEDLQSCRGQALDYRAQYFQSKYNYPASAFVTAHKQMLYEGEMVPDLFVPVVTWAQKLKAEGFLIGLVTAGRQKSTDFYLKRYPDLQNLFEVIVTGEDVARAKPHPEAYLLAAEKCGVTPGDCVGVEDSVVGMQAVKAAGMTCIIVNAQKEEKELYVQADRIVCDDDDVDLLDVRL